MSSKPVEARILRLANVGMVAVNLLGAATYLWFAVPLWAPPDLIDVPGAGAGSNIIWGQTALPAFAVCLLLNICWLIYTGIEYYWLRQRTIHPVYLAVPAIWAVTLYVDFSHHWTY